MFGITLYTRDGKPVTSVIVPPWRVPPEAYLWGDRTFFRREDGKYYEGMMFAAIPGASNHCLDGGKVKGAPVECGSEKPCSCACQGCDLARRYGQMTWLPLTGDRCDICGTQENLVETQFGATEKDVTGRRCQDHRTPVGGGV